MNELQIFAHRDFGEIRVIEQDGEPWFVATDVCRALELDDTGKATGRLDEDELTRIKLWSGGQNREMLAVNEPGLYSLVLGSRKPEAKAFKRWITHEVLPAIRQTGSYSLIPITPAVEQRKLTTDDYLKAAVIVANCRNERLPYVIGFLEQGGFSIPRLKSEHFPTQTVTNVINEAIKIYGLSVADICRLTGIDAVQIGRYKKGISTPKPERASFIIKVITDAVTPPEN